MQPALTDLGTSLAETTFCIVDLETTGSGADDAITEFGAVKVCGGRVLGEFQTLVDPGRPIAPLVTVLTGITHQMVVEAPTIGSVLPSFLEFLGDAVLVAHNARFDVGFLKRACAGAQQRWPNPRVLDTAALARVILLRDEVPNCKLSTLAAHFHSPTTPTHRALDDARATVDVLHGLIERVGNLGVHTVEDLVEFSRQVSPQRRAKRTWAADLPDAPGVYWFVADDPLADGRRVLYVGKATSLRNRVRSYFTAAETRRRMDEMVRLASGVEYVVCETALQAEVTELRLIAAHSPPYNRRSKFPHRLHWLKITDEPFPRLSVVRTVRDDAATYFGPVRDRRTADAVLAVLHDAFPVRRCTPRLAKQPQVSPCALAGMGRCLSPCDGSVDVDTYGRVVEELRRVLTTDVRPALSAVQQRLRRLVDQQRYEEAEQIRLRLSSTVAVARRNHRVASLARVPEVVAAARSARGWEIHVIRYGRLARAALARPGEVPQAVARAAVTVAETVPAPTPPMPACTVEETERVADWLESARIIDIFGDWQWPLHATINPDDLGALALGQSSRNT
ncbi:DEDD exonuclease domain-containing protein [Microlunatus sp. Y2014]|uniref:DEDD exonuclease domain-containing protein n=1 Tax=Microlunatus sp. Y2014 TaxID=3418488 RepID=UPI003DA6EE97